MDIWWIGRRFQSTRNYMQYRFPLPIKCFRLKKLEREEKHSFRWWIVYFSKSCFFGLLLPFKKENNGVDHSNMHSEHLQIVFRFCLYWLRSLLLKLMKKISFHSSSRIYIRHISTCGITHTHLIKQLQCNVIDSQCINKFETNERLHA